MVISRFIFQSSSPAGVYPPCRAASSWGPARQAAKVCSAPLTVNSTCIYVFHVGIRMPTIPRTVSPACRLHNTMCILRLQGGRRCVRHGKAKMGSVLRPLPRLSAGQRRMVALTLPAPPRTALYVVLCLCGHRFLLKKITECYAPAIQFDDHTHRRNDVAFL
jgi:hypothetical protein